MLYDQSIIRSNHNIGTYYIITAIEFAIMLRYTGVVEWSKIPIFEDLSDS